MKYTKGEAIQIIGTKRKGEYIKPYFEKHYVKIGMEVKVYGDNEIEREVVDPVVYSVREDLLVRSRKGIKEYNATLEREDYSLVDWLREIYEESLDTALYAKAAITKIEKS